MSQAGDIRRAIEAMERSDIFNNWGDPIMEACSEGDWLRRDDVLALFPQHHGGSDANDAHQGDPMNTSELTGALLDYWVARAEGYSDAVIQDGECCHSFEDMAHYPYSPSTDWAYGGPLLEKYKLCIGESEGEWGCVAPEKVYKSSLWAMRRGTEEVEQEGVTALEAICRVIVCLKFGDEVEDLPK